MYKPIVLALFLCISTLSWSQEAVVSGGNYHSNTTGSISWGVGETVIQTFATMDNIITQGFQQTKLTLTSVEEIPDLGYTISAYPNPTHDVINLKVESDELQGLWYGLFDQNGRIMKQGMVENNPLSIQLNNLPSGVYFLRVLSNSKMLKTFKVVKL